jgi:hypothetical protein
MSVTAPPVLRPASKRKKDKIGGQLNRPHDSTDNLQINRHFSNWSPAAMRTPAIILLCTLLPASVMAKDKDAAGQFDKPVKVAKVPLAPDPLNPSFKPVVTCSYFKDFAVKEINRGEVGAELSIVPLASGGEAYKCREPAAPGEIAVKEWGGYFSGVKGAYIFFRAEDGTNDGLGFAIFSPDGKKLFDDLAKEAQGPRAIDATASGLAMRYTRVYQADCSLFADPAGCWAKVRQATGLTQATAPDCAASYKAEEQRMKGTPNQAKIAALPSVVDYEAVATLDGGQVKISAAQGKIGCRLPD